MTTFHPASFRDPESGVLIAGDRVFRYFAGSGVADFQATLESGLLETLAGQGAIIGFERSSPDTAVSSMLPADAVVVEHPRLPFVSYAYEWPFGMLRAAALQHLALLRQALEVDLILKDSSTFNLMFVGPKPVFIDLGSFSQYTPGEPWQAYTQFCRMFLNPLLLQALAGIPYQSWLRSSLEGIPPETLSALLPIRHKLRPAVFKHVVLQALLQRRFANVTADQLGGKPQVPKQTLINQITSLESLIRSLEPRAPGSVWTGYEENNSYSEQARVEKAGFVEEALAAASPSLVWDLGCNRGEYSLIASRHAQTVVAMDADPATIDQLYHRVKDTTPNILPLVMDLLNPSPDQGWAGRERQGLASRGPADFALCLALIHHIRIGGNVPIRSFLDWLAGVARAAVVEFVPKSDPMVQRLLAWRKDVYDDYSQASFESALTERFEIRAVHVLPGPGRVLYSIETRSEKTD